jgi:hypothetical protein
VHLYIYSSFCTPPVGHIKFAGMEQKVEQRIFRKFSQWYYIDVKKVKIVLFTSELQISGKYDTKNSGKMSLKRSRKT